MIRFVLALLVIGISFTVAAKPPKVKKESVMVQVVDAAPSGAVLDIPPGAIALWQARWWGHKPKPAKAPQCGPGTTVTFAVPPALAKGWKEARLYKWLGQLAQLMQPPSDLITATRWQLGRSALAPRQVTVYCEPPPPATAATNPVFHWSVGTQVAYTDAAADGGPRAIGLEGLVAVQLRLWLDWLWLRLELSPGYTWGIDGEEASSFSLSEAAVLEFQVTDWAWVVLGGRHRVAFNAEGDNFNAMMAEVGGRFRVWEQLYLGLLVDLGSAWFPVYVTADRADLPYWVDIPPAMVQAATGFTGGLSLTAEWRF